MDANAELAHIEERRLQSLVRGDTAAAAPLHADDFQLVTPGGAVYTKRVYLDAIDSGEVDYVLWEPIEIDVRVCGDAACLRYRADLDIVYAGEPVGLRRYWHTDYYERRDGTWQVVFSHATQIR
jgi:hypothetical protein